MKVEELRLGNLYIDEDGNESVVNLDTFRRLCECIIEENDLSAIPLTEEWLVKFGFSDIKEQTLNVKTFCKTFRVGKCTEQQTLFVELGSRGWTFIRVGYPLYNYVHQLQNLYFALTNEELTIK